MDSRQQWADLIDRLRKIREDLGMSQDELAAKSGVLQPHIARIERHRVPQVQPGTLARLATAMGTDIYRVMIDMHEEQATGENNGNEQ